MTARSAGPATPVAAGRRGVVHRDQHAVEHRVPVAPAFVRVVHARAEAEPGAVGHRAEVGGLAVDVDPRTEGDVGGDRGVGEADEPSRVRERAPGEQIEVLVDLVEEGRSRRREVAAHDGAQHRPRCQRDLVGRRALVGKGPLGVVQEPVPGAGSGGGAGRSGAGARRTEERRPTGGTDTAVGADHAQGHDRGCVGAALRRTDDLHALTVVDGLEEPGGHRAVLRPRATPPGGGHVRHVGVDGDARDEAAAEAVAPGHRVVVDPVVRRRVGVVRDDPADDPSSAHGRPRYRNPGPADPRGRRFHRVPPAGRARWRLGARATRAPPPPCGVVEAA